MNIHRNSSLEPDEIVWNVFKIVKNNSSLGIEQTTHYTIAILLLKFFSDLSLDRSSSESPTTSWPAAWRDLHIPPECRWSEIHNRDLLPAKLDSMVAAIKLANPTALGQAFDGIQFEKLAATHSPTREPLWQALNVISELELRPSRYDNLGALKNLLEKSLYRLLEQPQSGFFEVPRTLSILLAQLLDPKPGESVLDPVCGTGLHLTQMAAYANQEGVCIFGQHRHFQPWIMCKINLLLQGIPNENIVLADALSSPLLEGANLFKADLVVSNPPFSLKLSDPESLRRDPWKRFRRGLPPSSRADYAFLSHIVEATREDTGRAAVIVPPGALFRGDESTIRRSFVEENLIAAVIALPPNLFQETRIAVSLVIFNKGKKTDRTLFIDASRLFKSRGKTNVLTEAVIARIKNAYKSTENIPELSYWATLEEIRAKDYQLSAPQYVEASNSTTSGQTPEALLSDIIVLEDELREVRIEIDAALKRLEFDEL